MGQLDQFAKDTFARETETVTHGAVKWQLPPEVAMSEVRLDGLLHVLDGAALATLPPPWCALGPADELAIEIKMQGDHLDLLALDRALLRRLARQIQRREDSKERFDGEVPLWFIAAHVPAVIQQRRALTLLAPGCYRIGPEWLATMWIAANDLPLEDELVPFLIARTGRALDAFVRWVIGRRPVAWSLRMLESLPMSTATLEDFEAELKLFRVGERTDDPDRRARQQMILGWILNGLPEEREKLKLEGKREGKLQEAREALRTVLKARRLSLRPEDEARIDECQDHDTLGRWLEQAVAAATTADALR